MNRIASITNEAGVKIDDPKELALEVVDFFDQILNNKESSNLESQVEMLKNIPKIINKPHNKRLSDKFIEEEVKNALILMNPDKSLGPDGFSTIFFQKCWHFVGKEVMEALEGVKNSGKILKEVNNTFISLIPKKDKPSNLNDYKLIALCNTLYKLLTKTLSLRLQKLLPLIISEEQTSFVPGRSIFDGVIIAQEAIHSIQKNKKPSMLIKLDIKKAYDKVGWRFLCKCLEAFGFSKSWINLIFECISTPMVSILVNETPEGFFNISRGLRQGDPISPFLFIIMAKALGRTITTEKERGNIDGITITSQLDPTTHQHFVDDTLLYGSSSRKEERIFKKILETYTKASGQEINSNKSKIFFFNTDRETEKDICGTLNFKIGALPCKYLGLPLIKDQREKFLGSCHQQNQRQDEFLERQMDLLCWENNHDKISSVNHANISIIMHPPPP